jgi:hypothetical protein
LPAIFLYYGTSVVASGRYDDYYFYNNEMPLARRGCQWPLGNVSNTPEIL